MFVNTGDRVVVKTNTTGGTRCGIVKKVRTGVNPAVLEWLVRMDSLYPGEKQRYKWFNSESILGLESDFDIFKSPEKEKENVMDEVWNDLNENFRVYANDVSREVVNIIFSGPKTIVFWKDGTKTIVSKSEDEPFDAVMAVCAAYTKKHLGSMGKIRKIIREKSNIEKYAEEFNRAQMQEEDSDD